MAEPTKAPVRKVTVYIALAPFEQDGEKYKAGDEVVLPGWVRDLQYDEYRKETHIGDSAPAGMTFVKEGPIVDKVTKERNVYRVTLPVKEQ